MGLIPQGGLINHFLQQKAANEQAAAKRKEKTRKVFEDFMKNAVETGNQDQLIELSKGYRDVGGDPAPFLNAARQRTPEQKLTDTFNQILAEKMGLAEPKTKSPFDSTEIAVNQGAGAQLSPTQTPARQALDSLFTPEFAARVTAYKSSKIDIGEHTPNQRLEWFNSLSKMQQANPELSMDELFNANLTKFGWSPEEATHLKDLPEYRREAISESTFAKYFNDPEIQDLFKKSFPKADADKALAGFVLNAMRRQQTPIPKRLQPFLDQFDNLHDDMVEYRLAEEAEKTKRTTKARLAGEFEMEPVKPISAEDRAKYGIDSSIPTYESLADKGFRFPSEADRKSYQEFSAARETIKSLKPMIDAIFKGIGDDVVSRKASQFSMIADVARGTERGKQIELYKDSLSAIARQLVRAAGESGGRYTDKDVAQVMQAAPDLGGFAGPPDSEALANMKFERWITSLNKMLAPVVEGVVIKPTKQSAQPKAQDPFTKGKTYRDAQGREAKYLGDGKWQTISPQSK
jgi:hypothetical protein